MNDGKGVEGFYIEKKNNLGFGSGRGGGGRSGAHIFCACRHRDRRCLTNKATIQMFVSCQEGGQND